MTAVQYLLLAVGEVAWAYPWSLTAGLWIMRVGQPALELPAVAGILLMGLVATRLLAATRWPSFPARAILTLLGLAVAALAALLELPAFRAGRDTAELWNQLVNSGFGGPAAAAAGFAAFLSWRSLGLGRSRPNLTTVEDGFRSGVVAMTTLLVFVALAGAASPLPTDVLLLSTLLMVSTGLVGMPLARVVDVGARPRHRGGPGVGLAGPWLAMLLGVVGGLLLVALLLAQLFTFERVAAAWNGVSEPVGAIVRTAVYLLAIPVGLLVELMLFLIRLLQRPGTVRPRQAADGLDFLEQMQQREPGAISPELLLAMKVALAVGLGLLLIWMVARVLARWREGWDSDGVEETHDIVWSWPGPEAVWRWLLARWRPIQVRAGALAGGRSSRGGKESVRALYREFLSLGAGLGRARGPAETALEYQRRLLADPSLSGSDEVLSLTEGYHRERYGPPGRRPTDLQPLASAVARLRALWREVSRPRA